MAEIINAIKTAQELLSEARIKKEKLNGKFTWLVGVALALIVALILITTGLGITALFCRGLAEQYGWKVPSFYSIIAVDIILIWIGVLFRYYVWVIYFFNINLGLTDEDWAELRARKESGEEVDYYKIKNPHAGSSLGIPEGTVRGTLAISLAVGALALLIASLGMDTTMPGNQLFIDVFDFFKTAFLMMVAFYFGNKSLQYLNYGNPIKRAPNNNSGNNAASSIFPANKASSQGLAPAIPANSGLKQQSNQVGASAPDIASGDEAAASIESGYPSAKG